MSEQNRVWNSFRYWKYVQHHLDLDSSLKCHRTKLLFPSIKWFWQFEDFSLVYRRRWNVLVNVKSKTYLKIQIRVETCSGASTAHHMLIGIIFLFILSFRVFVSLAALSVIRSHGQGGQPRGSTNIQLWNRTPACVVFDWVEERSLLFTFAASSV